MCVCLDSCQPCYLQSGRLVFLKRLFLAPRAPNQGRLQSAGHGPQGRRPWSAGPLKHMSRHRGSAYIASGEDIFHRFCADTGLANCASLSLFDHHNVVDEMSWDTAVNVGVALSHIDNHCSFLLSYGAAYRRMAFDENRDCFPMVAEMDGYIFTDVRCNASAAVHVYQDDWMTGVRDDRGRRKCAIIGVSGDKGQVAELFDKPAILFDDREDNVIQVLQARRENAGCVARVGQRFHHRVRTNASWRFAVSRNSADWHEMSEQFRDQVLRRNAMW